jgi:hypothetical protein
MRRFALFAVLGLAMFVPTTVAAKTQPASETIRFSRPLPTHVNERTPLSATVKIKHLTEVGKFCFDVEFVGESLNATESFFFVIDGNDEHSFALPPSAENNPSFASLCTTDSVNIAAVQDGKFTFVFGINQGSLDIARITTSYSPPGCVGCP